MVILEREARLAKLAGYTIDQDGKYVRPDGIRCKKGRPPHFLSDLNVAFEHMLPILEPNDRAALLTSWANALSVWASMGRKVSFVTAASLLCDGVEYIAGEAK